MKPLILKSFLSLIASALILNLNPGCSDKPDILLVTGGHSFDTADFFSLFLSDEGISVDTVSQPFANLFIEKINTNEYDAIVFYDMWQEITQTQKEAYQKLLENGTGMIFLHHSLVSYQDWEDIISIRGGKYREKSFETDSSKLSGYEHDLDLQVIVLDKSHPVTRDINDFEIHDEGYYNIEMLPSLHPLLGTSHPLCAGYVAWTNEYKKSRIVYIMLGHDRQAYENSSFKQLIRNAVHWAGRGR
jgi:type 1 glutamine amidotransferase